jgi:GntR family transcriptional regulator
MLRAYNRRVGDGDVEALALMLGLAEEIETAIIDAVSAFADPVQVLRAGAQPVLTLVCLVLSGGYMHGPMYQLIAEDIRRKIESGELDPGALLPSEDDLMDQYHASRNTVRGTLRQLMSLGLVETRHGQGTFVVKKTDPFVTTLDPDSSLGGEEVITREIAEAAAAGRTLMVSEPLVEVRRAHGVVTSELQLAEGSEVVSRLQQRYIDGVPYALQTTFCPMSLVKLGAFRLLQVGDIPGGVTRYLEEELGVKQASQRDTITVRSPDRSELDFFRLAADGREPVIEIGRTGFDESGRPFRFTMTAYPAGRNKFVLSTTNPPAATHGRSDELKAVRRSDSLAGHAFISYVHEDSRQVNQLQQTLEAAGVPVWRDTDDLWPGEDWRAKIRRAITDKALVFIACFSQASISRRKSYQNEELELAIREMRLRPPDDLWLIPVRLSECEIPDREIGAGRTLTSIQRADLFGDRADEGTARLVAAILQILGRYSDTPL